MFRRNGLIQKVVKVVLLSKKQEKYITENGVGKCLALHAQCRITAFYQTLGFTEFSDIDDDEGCPHIWMKKSL